MPKRQNPLGDPSPLQLKSHIGVKEVDMGVNEEENMRRVYAKTKDLLFEGSKKVAESPFKLPASEQLTVDSATTSHVLPGQLRLDTRGQLCSNFPDTNGHTMDGAAAAPVLGENEAMDAEMTCTSEFSHEQDADQAQTCSASLLRGQMYIDPDGHLCSGIKAHSINHQAPPATLGFRICQSCNRPSNVGARPCFFCDKLTCNTCLRQCSLCSGLFCQICSVLNYDENFERSFCLQCSNM